MRKLAITARSQCLRRWPPALPDKQALAFAVAETLHQGRPGILQVLVGAAAMDLVKRMPR